MKKREDLITKHLLRALNLSRKRDPSEENFLRTLHILKKRGKKNIKKSFKSYSKNYSNYRSINFKSYL